LASYEFWSRNTEVTAKDKKVNIKVTYKLLYSGSLLSTNIGLFENAYSEQTLSLIFARVSVVTKTKKGFTTFDTCETFPTFVSGLLERRARRKFLLMIINTMSSSL
jgi:hypothetical protein